MFVLNILMFIVKFFFYCKGAFIIKYVHFMLYAAESICKGSEEKIYTCIHIVYCIKVICNTSF